MASKLCAVNEHSRMHSGQSLGTRCTPKCFVLAWPKEPHKPIMCDKTHDLYARQTKTMYKMILPGYRNCGRLMSSVFISFTSSPKHYKPGSSKARPYQSWIWLGKKIGYSWFWEEVPWLSVAFNFVMPYIMLRNCIGKTVRAKQKHATKPRLPGAPLKALKFIKLVIILVFFIG